MNYNKVGIYIHILYIYILYIYIYIYIIIIKVIISVILLNQTCFSHRNTVFFLEKKQNEMSMPCTIKLIKRQRYQL